MLPQTLELCELDNVILKQGKWILTEKNVTHIYRIMEKTTVYIVFMKYR